MLNDQSCRYAIKQHSFIHSFQFYAEKLLALGEDAFEGQTNDAVQKQLVGISLMGYIGTVRN